MSVDASVLEPRRSRRILRRAREFLRELPGTGKRFWVLVVLTGAAAGLGAVFLVQTLRLFEDAAWPPGTSFLASIRKAPLWYRFTVPALGGVIVTLAGLAARRPMGGHGTAGIIESIWFRSGRLPFGWSFYRGVVSIVAVALGAPLGREGALLQFGAATGSALGQRLKISADQMRLLVACGAAAGMAAAYNVPIGASVFGLEVLLGSFAIESFGPIVVACVVGTLISRILIANHPSYVIPHHALLRARELGIDLAVGPILGVACALYNKTLNGFVVAFDRVPKKVMPVMPIAAMALVGVTAIWLPELLGNGYDAVNLSLLGKLPWTLLLILPGAKMIVTALTSAAGVPGGLFTPSLYFGALLGGALGHLIHLVAPSAAPAGAYALIGMGAVLAGTTHAPVSAVLIIFELTGSYEVILPLMLTSVLAAAVSRKLEPRSLYSAPLSRRNLGMPSTPVSPFAKVRSALDIMTPGVEQISARAPFQEVVARMIELPPGHDLYVTTPEGRLAGTIFLDAMKGQLPDHGLLDAAVASDVMDTRIVPLGDTASLSEIASRFAETYLERLPVTDARGHVLGTVSKRDVLRYAKF